MRSIDFEPAVTRTPGSGRLSSATSRRTSPETSSRVKEPMLRVWETGGPLSQPVSASTSA